LTTQVPTHMAFWTSGRTRSYKMGQLVMYLQHVPDWQLVLWNEPEGELVRTLVWAGLTEVSNVLRQLTEKVPDRAIRQLQNHASLLPLWIPEALRRLR
jgi:EAL domain-containing protein (putative c-di-GMP-specific phosphodiesterase class I)